MANTPLIPFSDYKRIFLVIYSISGGLGSDASKGCLFFSVAGAAILEKFYKIKASPVVGAAFYRIDEKTDTILSFGSIPRETVTSSRNAFHCWLACENHVIDFMAPIFNENLLAAGYTGNCPRKMFQKNIKAMAESPHALGSEGDFYLAQNLELQRELLSAFLSRPMIMDLVSICLDWYRKPPKPIKSDKYIQNELGEITKLKLSSLDLSGVW